MDCRDIKEIPGEVKGGKYFDDIFNLQKELIDHYVEIEGLPKYPININTKSSQTLIKDFVGRVIEELAEGFESFVLAKKLTEENKLWDWEDMIDKDKYKMMLSHLQNLNEEQADALHFMVELMIYSNIYPEDVKSFIKSDSYISNEIENISYYVVPEISMDEMEDMALFGLAGTCLVKKLVQVSEISNKKRDLLGYAIREGMIEDEGLYRFGRLYNSNESLENYLWAITYHLNIARNSLKNKPWKQTEMMTDELVYQSEVVKGFLCMMSYFYRFGFYNSEELHYMYFKKNMVNRFRIRSNY